MGGEEIGQTDPFARFDLNVGENGGGNDITKSLAGFLVFGGMGNNEMIVSREVAQALDEVAIDTGADSEREDIRSGVLVFDEVEDCGSGVDKAIGDEDKVALGMTSS